MHLCRHTLCIYALMTALAFLPATTRAASFNYLYIEASEGNSSGGHAAIEFGDEVYHYQHLDSGLIQLFKLEKDQFHFLYRYLQNRPIHMNSVNVSDETFHLLREHFKWEYLTQQSRYKLLDDLEKDRGFIRHLLHQLTGDSAQEDEYTNATLRLKGVGLFYSDQDHQSTQSKPSTESSPLVKKLRQKVEQIYGADFLQQRRTSINLQIKALTPLKTNTLKPDFSLETLPSSIYSFKDQYSDVLTGLYAIKVLQEAQPLQPNALFRMEQQTYKISEAERQILLNLRKYLETSLVKSVNSNRPGWGYAVLVNIARYIAVETSLQTNYWTFIDDFADDSDIVSADEYQTFKQHMQILAKDAGTAFDQIRQSAVKDHSITEAQYSQFEMAANRYHEMLKGEQHINFRYNGENSLPIHSIRFPDSPAPNLSQEQLTIALSTLTRYENNLFQHLKTQYPYDLISQNCVTELIRNINQALLETTKSANPLLPEQEALAIVESEKRLGGYVVPDYNFIPFVSYETILDSYHVNQNRYLNSYRGLELAKLKTQQNRLMTALQESNILTSSVYRYNPDDALFVFFTDRHVLLRPVFGAFNTAASLSQSIFGLFSWPLDSGVNLQTGVTGILMSLPELLFVNIRKGSYKYLSFNKFKKSDWTER